MRDGGQAAFEGRRRTAASCFQAHPPQAVARRVRLERDELAQYFKGLDRVAASRLLVSRHLYLP